MEKQPYAPPTITPHGTVHPTVKLLIGPGGLKIVLDKSQVILDNPGAGTPAMVYTKDAKANGTFWCAVDTGEVDGVRLTDPQCEWLQEQDVKVNEFLYGARNG